MSVEPKRIQLRRTRGYKKPEGAVVVSRPSRWGNMFKIGELVQSSPYGPFHPWLGVLPEGRHGKFVVRRVRDAADAVALFAEYIAANDDVWDPETIRRELGGRDLACWCPLPESGEPDICHGAVLLAIANEPGVSDGS